MPTNRKRVSRKVSAVITPEVIKHYRARNWEALQRELGWGDGDRSPLDPYDKCWNLLACWSDESNIRRAELIRDRIEAIIKAEGATDVDK